MEIEQLRESKRTIKQVRSEHLCQWFATGLYCTSLSMMQSKLPGNSLQAKHTEINVVKDAVVLRKIWLQQALILISQVCVHSIM